MTEIIAAVLSVFSVLVPVKQWVAPHQPLEIRVEHDAPVKLVMNDFFGKVLEPLAPIDVQPGGVVDLKALYREASLPGTYIAYAVPPDGDVTQAIGTPLLISVRADRRRDAPGGAMVTRISPLRYVEIESSLGTMTAAFFYDVAPHTVDNFLSLAEGGFYDGLSFFRLVPEFIVQTGDPRNDGTGGPGYTIDAEFSDRRHQAGVLSMARQIDPLESQGAPPRPESANSAGSQFFIVLDDRNARRLDRRYTAFARVVEGMDVVQSLAAVEVPPGSDRPTHAPVVMRIRVLNVVAGKNPYLTLMNVVDAR
jgi:cyclophilin family peptidyl-prolyl cis-trans isomerase